MFKPKFKISKKFGKFTIFFKFSIFAVFPDN